MGPGQKARNPGEITKERFGHDIHIENRMAAEMNPMKTKALMQTPMDIERAVQRCELSAAQSLSSDDACRAEDMLKVIDTRLEYLRSTSFRRNQWRWRRKRCKMSKLVDTEVSIPCNLLVRPSLPRWRRSYTVPPAELHPSRRGG